MRPHQRLIRFGDHEVDCDRGTVRRNGDLIDLAPRYFDLLRTLLEHPGEVVSRRQLVTDVWRDTHITDSTIDQAISALRRTFGPPSNRRKIIVSHKKIGFRFTGAVEYVTPDTLETTRASDAATDPAADATVDLEALLTPHVALINGRAALEGLTRERIPVVIAACTALLDHPKHAASANTVLANALVFQFESTRADATPDVEALRHAERHARVACTLSPHSADAWGALAHAFHRLGSTELALGAAREAVSLAPGEWRFHLRLGFIGGGAERLRAGNRVLDLSPHNALAHWLAATVFIARQAWEKALTHLVDGSAAQDRQLAQTGVPGRVHAVGLHWLRGLVLARLGDIPAARTAIERELTFADTDHIVGREVCAASFYALGALDLRAGRHEPARRAFEQALARLPEHALSATALSGLEGLEGQEGRKRQEPREGLDGREGHDPMAAAIAQSVALTMADRPDDAAGVCDAALRAHAAAGPGAAWVLPVEPLLNVSAHPDAWHQTLAQLHDLAS